MKPSFSLTLPNHLGRPVIFSELQRKDTCPQKLRILFFSHKSALKFKTLQKSNVNGGKALLYVPTYFEVEVLFYTTQLVLNMTKSL